MGFWKSIFFWKEGWALVGGILPSRLPLPEASGQLSLGLWRQGLIKWLLLVTGSAALILGISESSWHPSVKYLTPEILHLLPRQLLGPFPLSSKTYTEIPQPLEITHLGRSVVSLTQPQTHSSASFPTKLSPTQCPNTPRMLVKPRLGSTWCRLEALSPSMPQPHLMWGLSLPSFTDGEVNQSIHDGARIWLQGCQTAESTFSLLG